MNVVVDKQKFTKHIKILEKVTGKQLNLEVLKCVLIEADEGNNTLSLRATNLNLSPISKTVSPVANMSTSPLLILVIIALNFSLILNDAIDFPINLLLDTNILLTSYFVLS